MLVGFWISDKKWKKLNIQLLEKLLSARGHEVVRVDLDQPLDQQGPFGAIIHKVSDEIAKADQGDLSAQRKIHAFEKYIGQHPEVAVFDPIAGVRLLMNRDSECRIVIESDIVTRGEVYAPPFVTLTSTDVTENMQRIAAAGVCFPFVCKPLLAHGHGEAHMMSLVFNPNGMNDIRCPCVAQSFINHNARLYKLFIIRDKYYVVERPSLKNFSASGEFDRFLFHNLTGKLVIDHPTIHFNTHTISKPDSSSSLTERDDELNDSGEEQLSKEKCDKIVEQFRHKLGLALFGIDVIVERGTGRHAIIDMNVFPGYDGVPSFMEDLCDMISEEIRKREDAAKVCVAADSRSAGNKAAKAKLRVEGANDIDSGIDTSDSCDEKKPKEERRHKVKPFL